MKITYAHYRFAKHPQPFAEEMHGRHGVAYHYQRGYEKKSDGTRARKTRWEPLPRGGYTVCTIYRDDGTEVAFGVADCSPLDSFSYKTGREIARGRAIKDLFGLYGSGAIYMVFVGLGWTKARTLSDFIDENEKLFGRFYNADYFLKGSVLDDAS